MAGKISWFKRALIALKIQKNNKERIKAAEDEEQKD